jgi:chromosome segregation ATPase
MKSLETGVDKLVAIISTSKRISLDEASKKLGVGANVVQEWAEFLEKEKLITLEYSLSKIWLCEKKLSKIEVKGMAKEISSEKDAFARKIDTAIKSLENETAGFEEIKRQFVRIQSQVKDEITVVEKELSDLDKFTKLKESIGKTIQAQKDSYENSISEVLARINKDKAEYTALTTNLASIMKNVDTSTERVKALQTMQQEILTKVSTAKDHLKQISAEVTAEEDKIKGHLSTINALKTKADELQTRIQGNSSTIANSTIKKINDDHSKMIAELNTLLNEAEQKTKNVQTYAALQDKIRGSFKGFFDKKIQTEQMIVKIEEEKTSLKKSLEILQSRIKGLDLMASSKDLKVQSEAIALEMKNYEMRRMGLMGKIDTLFNFIKS